MYVFIGSTEIEAITSLRPGNGLEILHKHETSIFLLKLKIKSRLDPLSVSGETARDNVLRPTVLAVLWPAL